MNLPNPPLTDPPAAPQLAPERPHFWRYLQPLIAYAALTILCFCAIRPSQALDDFGHLLGEHTFSIYNLLLVTAAVLMFLADRLRRDPAIRWRVADLALCCALTSWGLKGLFFHLTRPSGGPAGFPSGHALTAFAASYVLMETFSGLSPYAFVIAVLVGWSRVEIHEHYVYQVLIGALLGIAIGYGVTKAPRGVGLLLPRLLRRRANA